MAVVTHRQYQIHLARARQARRQEKQQKIYTLGLQVSAAVRAGWAGGLGLTTLMLLGLVPPPDALPVVSLAILVIPGFFVASIATGLLAGVLGRSAINSYTAGGQVGWMAGFWSGIFGSMMAMILAANGRMMINFGKGVVVQFTPEQLDALSNILSPYTLALIGRVFGALVVYGLIGALLAALLASLGGMIYVKLSRG